MIDNNSQNATFIVKKLGQSNLMFHKKLIEITQDEFRYYRKYKGKQKGEIILLPENIKFGVKLANIEKVEIELESSKKTSLFLIRIFFDSQNKIIYS